MKNVIYYLQLILDELYLYHERRIRKATMKELVDYRRAIGKTQQEMADLLNISYSMYQKLEYGIVKPSIETIKKFRETFKDFDINIFLK